MRRRGLAGASALALFAGLAAPAAFAQTSAGDAAASGGEGSDGSATILVTARRVSESVQDVPAAVTAIGGDDLANLLVDDTASLIEQIPGASLVTSGPNYIADTSLRGQGGGRVGSSESATGLYRDGHYAAGGGFGGRALNQLDLFDLQRVEVLRGPQGALYGRNAVGGSINAIARKPDLARMGGWARVGYDSFDTIELAGALNVPLVTDRLALRVAGFINDQNGGSVTNVPTGHTIDQNSSTGLRAALAWQIADNIDTRFTYENFYNRTPAFGSLGYRPTKSNGTPLDPGMFERVMSREAYARIKQRTAYWDTQIATDYGDWHINFDYKHRTGARLDEDLAHFLGFEGIIAGGKLIELYADETETFENGGAQIYLTSPKSDGRWTWLVGIDGLINRTEGLTVNRGVATAAGLRALFRNDASIERLRSFAVYGALGYDIAPKWNLGLELRVQRDRKSIDFDRTRNSTTSLAVPISVDLTRNWTRVLPTATLRYEVSDAHTLYARFATGYRPGGFNTGIPADNPAAADLIPYNPENVYGGELGWKASLGGAWTANLALYYTRTKNVQAVTAASITNPQFILQNAGNDHIYGAELEVRGRIELGFGKLDLNAALAANDGSFEKGTTVLDDTGHPVDISGLRVNRTRDLQATLGATLKVPLGSHVTASLGANMQTESGGFENAVNTRKLADFTLLDLTAGLTVDRWSFLLWAKNITDRNYVLQTISQNQYFNGRRQIGGRLTFAF